MCKTNQPAAPVFSVDGSPCTLADLLAANADDAEFCEWARVAQVGERFPALVECIRVE